MRSAASRSVRGRAASNLPFAAREGSERTKRALARALRESGGVAVLSLDLLLRRTPGQQAYRP